ncbi:3-ketoacyl-ACP reductase, partial [Streptomyces pharetrae]
LGPHFAGTGRPAEPEEQAAAVLLASDAVSNGNGVVPPVDDGWSAV